VKKSAKAVTIGLRRRKETCMESMYTQELRNRILHLELGICDELDAVGVAGIVQTITRKT
jgi:hypothetical protein